MNERGEEIVKQSTGHFLEKFTLEEIFLMAQSQDFACAIYRLPSSLTGESDQIKHLIIDLSSGKNPKDLHLEDMGSGFVFHPFSTAYHPAKFISCDIHLTENIGTKQVLQIDSSLADEELMKLFNASKTTRYAAEELLKNKSGKDRAKCKNEFIELIEKSIGEIRNNRFHKVVVARYKSIKLPQEFNSTDFFKALIWQYNNAFVYMTFIPGVGSWIGATPETLININGKRQFQTVALAATQAYREDIDIEDTTWSQKDIEEQAMVSRYIINCFKKIRLREFEEIGPRTHLSGNLVHLKTDYIVELDQVDFPDLGSVMLELLHPTSAVCGMPKEPALEFILKNEGFDREYFSGFLGPVNMENESNLFVNLRCMKFLKGHKASLFGGAGIIANSNPEKEWNETEIKMQTLLKVLSELYEDQISSFEE